MNISPDSHFIIILKHIHVLWALMWAPHTLGLALTHLGLNNASPLKVIRRTKYKHDLEELNIIITQWDIKGLVFGLPLNMNGTSGARVQATKTICA